MFASDIYLHQRPSNRAARQNAMEAQRPSNVQADAMIDLYERHARGSIAIAVELFRNVRGSIGS